MKRLSKKVLAFLLAILMIASCMTTAIVSHGFSFKPVAATESDEYGTQPAGISDDTLTANLSNVTVSVSIDGGEAAALASGGSLTIPADSTATVTVTPVHQSAGYGEYNTRYIKSVTVNGADPSGSYADGAYTFTITADGSGATHALKAEAAYMLSLGRSYVHHASDMDASDIREQILGMVGKADPNMTITSVQFYANGSIYGEGTFWVGIDERSAEAITGTADKESSVAGGNGVIFAGAFNDSSEVIRITGTTTDASGKFVDAVLVKSLSRSDRRQQVNFNASDLEIGVYPDGTYAVDVSTEDKLLAAVLKSATYTDPITGAAGNVARSEYDVTYDSGVLKGKAGESYTVTFATNYEKYVFLQGYVYDTDKYLQTEKSVTVSFVAKKYDTVVNVDASQLPGVWGSSLNDLANKVLVDVKDEKGNVIDNAVVTGSASAGTFAAGETFTLKVSYAGDDNYNASYAVIENIKLEEPLEYSTVAADLNNIGDAANVIVNSTELNADGASVKVAINNTFRVEVTPEDGKYVTSVKVDGTEVAINSIVGTTVYTEYVTATARNHTVTVETGTLSLVAKNGDVDYNKFMDAEADVIPQILDLVTGGTPTPTEAAEDFVVKYDADGNGNWKDIDYAGNGSGEHAFGANGVGSEEKIRITYDDSDDTYPATSTEITVTIVDNRGKTEVNLNEIEPIAYNEYTEEEILELVYENVTDANGNVVTVNDGELSMSIDSTNAGERTVKVTYAENKNYLGDTAEAKVTIEAAEADIIVNSKSVDIADVDTVTVDSMITATPDGVKYAVAVIGIDLDDNQTYARIDIPELVDVNTIDNVAIKSAVSALLAQINGDGLTVTAAELKAYLDKIIGMIEDAEANGDEIDLNVDLNTVKELMAQIESIDGVESLANLEVTITSGQDIMPDNCGVYAVAAVIADNNYTLAKDLGYLAIVKEPIEAEVGVADKIHVYDGTAVEIADLITKSIDDAKITVIVAGIDVSGDYSENGMAAVEEVVNVDFPTLVDETIKKYVPSIYTSGISVAQVVEKLDTLKGILDEMAMDTTYVDEVKMLLSHVPQDATVTFKETAEVNPTAIGAYLVGAVITDPDYTVESGLGTLLIVPETNEAELQWNYEDANGIITRAALDNIDLNASAYVDGVKNDKLTGRVGYIIVGADEDGNAVLTRDPSNLPNGVYTQIAYVIDEASASMYVAKPISRAFVIVENAVVVDVLPEEENVIDKVEVVYTGEQQVAPVTVKDVAGNDISDERVDENLTVTYIGIDTTGGAISYNSTEAPVNVGVYAVVAKYVEYGEDGKIDYVGADVDVLVITPAEAEFDVLKTEVPYDGSGKFTELVNTDALDYIAVIVDEDNNVNIILPEEWGIASGTYEDADAVLDAVIAELEGLKNEINTDEVVTKAIEKLKELYDEVVDSDIVDQAIAELKALEGKITENETVAKIIDELESLKSDLENSETAAKIIEKLNELYDEAAASGAVDEVIAELESIKNDFADSDSYEDVEAVINDLVSKIESLEAKLGENEAAALILGALYSLKDEIANSETVDEAIAEIKAMYEELKAKYDEAAAEIKAKIEAELEALKAEIDLGSVSAKLDEVLAAIDGIGTITINGELPSEVGVYDVSCIGFGANHKVAFDKDTLEIYEMFTLIYDKNTEDEVGNMPDPNPVEQKNDAVFTLSENVPTRTGYKFLGWSTVPEGPAEYQPGDKYEVVTAAVAVYDMRNSTVGNSNTLYAIWEKNAEVKGEDDVQTGDNFNKALWINVLLLSVMGMAVSVFLAYKKRKEEEEA